MKHSGGYQIPTDLHPEGYQCVQFEIPDSLFYIANFWGAIGELAKWTSYQRTGDDSGLQAANVMALVIDKARESFLNQCKLEPEIIEKIIQQIVYISKENDNDDSEGDDMCKCPNSVHYDLENKAFYYIDINCNRVPINVPNISGDFQQVGDAETPDVPEVASDFENYLKNTEAMKCSKATALVNEMWNVVAIHEGFDEVQGLFNVIAFFAAAIATWAGAAGAAAVSASASSIGISFTDLIAKIGLDQLKIKLQAITDNEEVKNELICDLVERMTIKTDLVSILEQNVRKTAIYDEDVKIAIERFAELVPESEEAAILLKAFPVKSWKEVVTPKIAGTACACADYTPNPPAEAPQTEPEAGEFGLFGGEIIGGISTSMTPEGSRSAANPRGMKVSETKYTLDVHDADTQQYGDLFVMWEASEMITEVAFEMLWKYTGTDSDGSNSVSYHYEFYFAEDAETNWAKMPDGRGEASDNDSGEPEKFFGAVNAQGLPWDNSIQTWGAYYVGLRFSFHLDSDNTPTSFPSGEVTVVTFKAKADIGGNYRASFIPLQWVPKTL